MRRRCFWCGVKLRQWQLNACRKCGFVMRDCSPFPGIGPLRHSKSGWDLPADKWTFHRTKSVFEADK